MKHSLIFVACLLALSGCKTMETITETVKEKVGRSAPASTAAEPPKAMFSKLPAKYEPSSQAIGAEGDVANNRAQGLGLVNIPELEAYLNHIHLRIKAEARLSDAPGRVYITAAAAPSAQASPDGNIYVSFGMLRNIESEDEVVALLSHEFGHVALGHHDSDIWGNYQKQIQSSYAMGAQILANLEAGRQEATLGNNQLGDLKKMQMAIEVTDRLLHPAWKRLQEEEADRIAIDISTRMGYSFGRGHKSLLEKLTTLEETQGKERQKAFEHRFATQANEGKLDLKGMAQHAYNNVLDLLARTHDDGAKRIAAAVAYHEALYDDLPRPEPKRKPWEEILKRPAVNAVFNNYRLADDASMALIRNDRKVALQLAEKAVTPPTDSHPYTLLMLAKAQETSGDGRGYERTLQRLEGIQEPVWQVYEIRAEREVRAGRRDNAEKMMEDGYQRFGGAPVLRPRMISFYEKVNRKDKSNAMAMDCSFKTPMQRDECLKAGGNMKNHVRGSNRRG